MHYGDGRAAGRLGLGEGKKYLQLEGILGRAWRSGSSKYGREAWLLSVVGRDSSERGMNLTSHLYPTVSMNFSLTGSSDE
jgi:hypothetical protein